MELCGATRLSAEVTAAPRQVELSDSLGHSLALRPSLPTRPSRISGGGSLGCSCVSYREGDKGS